MGRLIENFGDHMKGTLPQSKGQMVMLMRVGMEKRRQNQKGKL